MKCRHGDKEVGILSSTALLSFLFIQDSSYFCCAVCQVIALFPSTFGYNLFGLQLALLRVGEIVEEFERELGSTHMN
jgi:hypothetical protein